MKGISLQILKYSMLCVSVIFISSCTSGRGFKEEISTLNFGEVVEIKLNSIIGSDPALQINVPRERIEIEIKHSDGYNEILNLRQGIHKIRITNNPKYIYLKILWPPGNTYIYYQKGYLGSIIAP